MGPYHVPWASSCQPPSLDPPSWIHTLHPHIARCCLGLATFRHSRSDILIVSMLPYGYREAEGHSGKGRISTEECSLYCCFPLRTHELDIFSLAKSPRA